MKSIITLFMLQCVVLGFVSAQNFTSYFTGSTSDVSPTSQGGICLMGGSSEDDNAMKWFLERANGGDVLVLRTSGSDGYNSYFFNDLGIVVNSVESIVFNNASGSNESYIHERINKAEAIWFAGGNQWNYVSYWRNTPIDSLINRAILDRNIAIGGTSAGMAILGDYYFTAENGTVTSSLALANPFDSRVTIESLPFINFSILKNVITDTHYDDPDRKGRHAVFLARMRTDNGIQAKGIACDEYTAVCIDELGIAKVFGGHPTYNDNAYFLKVNCDIENNLPEVCSPGVNLMWNQNQKAIKVYTVKGTSIGSNTFNLNNWNSGSGGIWEDWSVNNGTLIENAGSPSICTSGQYSSAIKVKDGVLYIENEEGLILKGQDGNCYKLYIDATGMMVHSEVACPN